MVKKIVDLKNLERMDIGERERWLRKKGFHFIGYFAHKDLAHVIYKLGQYDLIGIRVINIDMNSFVLYAVPRNVALRNIRPYAVTFKEIEKYRWIPW